MSEFRKGDPVKVGEFEGSYLEPAVNRPGWHWLLVDGQPERVPASLIARVEPDWQPGDVVRDEQGSLYRRSIDGRSWIFGGTGANEPTVGRLTRLVPEATS